MNYRRITEFGDHKAPLRNIIVKVDGTELILDLIPAITLDEPGNYEDEPNEILRELLLNSKPIIEGKHFLRLEFEHILAVAIHTDIDVDLFGGLQGDWHTAPKNPPTNSYYPLLELCNSSWKSQLPDYQGRDDKNIHHIRAFSMECSLDVLGFFPIGNWVEHSENNM